MADIPTTRIFTDGRDYPVTFSEMEIRYRDLKMRYDELLYAVATKVPGESRHETALRYIRERGDRPSNGPCSATP